MGVRGKINFMVARGLLYDDLRYFPVGNPDVNALSGISHLHTLEVDEACNLILFP